MGCPLIGNTMSNDQFDLSLITQWRGHVFHLLVLALTIIWKFGPAFGAFGAFRGTAFKGLAFTIIDNEFLISIVSFIDDKTKISLFHCVANVIMYYVAI